MKALWKEPYRSDVEQLLTLYIPYIFTYLLQFYLMSTTSLIFMGWIGQLEFNACAIALALYALFGYSSHFGLTYACDTLLSQAYGGNKREMGTIIQRAMLIAINAVLIAWTFLYNAQYLTGFIAKNTQIARLINEYLSCSILMVPFEVFSTLVLVFTVNHGVTLPLLAINIIGNIVNIIAHYLLLYVFHFGIRAPPIAFSCAYLSMGLSCIIYLRASSIAKNTWHPWTRECLQGWTMYLKLGLPGVIVLLTQTLVYGGAVLLSSVFGNDAVTAQGVVFAVTNFFFFVSLAFGVSSNIVIGRYLGARQSDKAQQAKSVVYNTALIIAVIIVVCDFSLLYWIPYLFHTPASALTQTRYLLAIAISFVVLNFYYMTQASILKACGKQHIEAISLISSYLIVGVPSGILFIFVLHLQMAGYWFAIVLSLLIINTILFVFIRKIDWQQQAEDAFQRVSNKCEVDETKLPLINDQEKKPVRLSNLIKYKLILFIFLLFLFICSIILLNTVGD